MAVGCMNLDQNKDHDQGKANIGRETFRIRQLYSDAATAYLDGYQTTQKVKARNLLKLELQWSNGEKIKV